MRISDLSSDVCSSDLPIMLELQSYDTSMVMAFGSGITAYIKLMNFVSGVLDHKEISDGANLQFVKVALTANRRVLYGIASTSSILIHEIGRAHVCTPVTNAHLVCRLLLEKTPN